MIPVLDDEGGCFSPAVSVTVQSAVGRWPEGLGAVPGGVWMPWGWQEGLHHIYLVSVSCDSAAEFKPPWSMSLNCDYSLGVESSRGIYCLGCL